MDNIETNPLNEAVEESSLIAQKKQKLNELRKQGWCYPNEFKPTHGALTLHQQYGDKTNEELEPTPIKVRSAGRIRLKRAMGKASFLTIEDKDTTIQCYLKADATENYADSLNLDLGDIIGVEGTLFKTKTNELTIKAEKILLLTKTLRSLPDKWHGLTDPETRYRQRYLDLMVNKETRDVFKIRTQAIQYIRNFFIENNFLEVETPMMHPIPGGASAKPFTTHHNALNMQLFMRIAPELYLKRLVVGGFERVFEVNRNFRNEGISTRHNPEFTMLEFYQAYATYVDLMNLTEELLSGLVKEVCKSETIIYQGTEVSFKAPFARMSMKESVLHYNPELTVDDLNSEKRLREILKSHHVEPEKTAGVGKLLTELFELTVESKLIQPTFITEYPTEISPLARCSNHDASITDRFEFFITGREIANGFSELNDPEDQKERFLAQMTLKDAGDEEAMYFDEDYITALEYGLPPTAGEGIGIDRLMMLLTNSQSIRDVILFPHLKTK